MNQRELPVILFDGVCNLCNSTVQWIIDHDRGQVFRFASLQSQYARRIFPSPSQLPESVVLIDEQGIHTQATAAIRIARRLGFPWSLAAMALVAPASLRDAVYRWIARNRYSWFGRTDSCRLPSPELRSRFLD